MGLSLSVRAAARERGDAVALVGEDGETSWTQLALEVEARASALAAIGAGPEARVAVIGDPVRERIVDVLAAIELGAPLVMLHPRWTEDERERVIAETEPCIVLGRDPIADVDTDARSGASLPADAASFDASRTLALLYTSGTTGRARAAILSRRAFLASARASAAVLPLEPSDR
ncbi:MAG: long-chain fatty acid--CoA ligase, partial [Myxococcota bacterium]|nr:long-chain fatty acid--CoA ligase [Myxococcota bacterium]